MQDGTAGPEKSLQRSPGRSNCVQTELSSLISYMYLKHQRDAWLLTDCRLSVTNKQLPGFMFDPLLLGTPFASDTT